ncbi:MAG TPA: lanthionine synthetase C family protein [Frankiaceae bacterium]|nr:lanthionine synthetase C family protein [Frankiaceae bacterium]
MTAWRAILDDEQAARARDAVRDVEAALTPEAVASSGHALGSGSPGIALLHVALGDTDRAEAVLDTAIEAVAEEPRVGLGFYGTTVGLSWALSAIGRRLGLDDPDESDLDQYVPRALAAGPWPGHFDLINGLVGLGAYCLERLPRPSARSGLDAVVAQLAGLARRSDGGVAWFTTPAIYPPRAQAYPEGHWDVGFAHGNAGVVALLAAATREGVAEAEPLLRDAVRWLSSWRGPAEGAFPAIVTPEGVRAPARMAWCYGDPGVALALLAAGRALGDAALLEAARDVALGCAGRVETSGIVDASLCHGTAGAGHLFNRLGQALGEERLVDLARFWLLRALDEWATPVAAYGLLEGAAGTALALLSATGEDPWWDYPLLLGTAG